MKTADVVELDKIDCEILDVLQRDGRITNLELAQRVNLSPTPCALRVKKMEQVGIITGYSAIVEPGAAGLAIEAIVLIQISDNTRQAAEDFAAAVAKLPSVLTCDMTAGKLDYVVRVLARDLPHYEEIIKDHLGSLPNVVSMETLFVLNPLVRAKPVLFGK